MGEFFRRLRYLLNRGRFDRELSDEMNFHREMSERTGSAKFGNTLRLREEARDAWGWTWIDRLLQDLRYGLRVLAASPGFTLVAVLVLAIGIGVNIAAFSLFDMIALKPLPVRDAHRIVRLERRSPDSYTSEMSFPSFLFYRQNARSLAAAIAVLGVPPMQIDDDLQGTSTSFVTANYFTELGTRAAYGRMFSPALDSRGDAPAVAIISYALWQRRFAGDPSVIGRTIRLNYKPVIIVGVAPYALATLGSQHPDIWLPIAKQPFLVDGSNVLQDFNQASVRMWGKLAPGVSFKAAEDELRRLTVQLRHDHPNAVWPNEFLQVSPGGYLQVMRPEMYRVAEMVGVLTFLILAVACGNLGALLLARAIQREREIGIRLALGGSAGRIFRQLFTESLLLASLGAVAGLFLGCAVIRVAQVELDAPKWLTAMPDIRVLLFTVAMTFASTVLFGLTPALQIARRRQHKTLARQILVSAQVAGSCVLLITAGLLVRATQHALYSDPGFGYEELLSVDAHLAQHGYEPARAQAYLEEMQARLRTVPGVRSTSLVLLPPLGHTVSLAELEINGRSVRMYPNWVDPSFFRTLQIPLRLGRTFRPGEKNAVIVSESFADAEWGNANPLGKLIGDGPNKDVVVGVAGDAHVNAVNEDDAVEEYWPADKTQMSGMVVMVRAAGNSEGLPEAPRRISKSLDPKLLPEIRRIKTLYLEMAMRIEQVTAIATLIGFVAALLAGVGLIGLVSFAAWLKAKEIAIRLALGARSTDVLRAILGQFSWPVFTGLLLGTSAAAAGSGLLRRALFGVSNLDPLGYASAILMLIALLAGAALLPATRALKVNVSRALRYD